MKAAYLAIEEFKKELEFELNRAGIKFEVMGLLYVTEVPAIEVYFCQNIWFDWQKISLVSIKQGATLLKGIQRNWAPYSFHLHRRVALIQEALPHVSAKAIDFMQDLPTQPMGAYTLIDNDTLMYSAKTSSIFPLGVVRFNEDKTNPPSRAYLKLWEFFTVTGLTPGRGEICMDLGACPGGWTWVLSELGAQVIAVDKAPIDEKLMLLKNVKYQEGSAFGLEPSDFKNVKWVFSDIICYPERLYQIYEKWSKTGVKNFVFTLKFQGETDYATIDKFSKLANAKIVHLYHNKHELTFYLVG